MRTSEVLKMVLKNLDDEMVFEFDNIVDGIDALEKSRQLKKYAEEICGQISQNLLDLFEKENVPEVMYRDKLVKPAWLTKYNCEKLIEKLPFDKKLKLLQYQPLHLNKTIVDKAIEDRVLNVASIDDLISAGLVKKKVKQYIKFCDPDSEAKRQEQYLEWMLKKAQKKSSKSSN